MKVFIPKKYQKDIFSIDYQYLKDNGYKLIIFDLDNTIGLVKDKVCKKETVEFLNNLNKLMPVVIASNSLKKRVSSFCSQINCDKMYFSLKPSLKILRKIKKKYQIDYSQMVIIGDQLLTDIICGNRRGLLTILVDQLGSYDLKKTRINRKIEKIIKRKYKIQKGVYY